MRIKEALKTMALIIYKNTFNISYKTISFFKKRNTNKALFILSRSKRLDGNLQYVYEELMKQKPSIEIQFIHTENKMKLKLFLDILELSDASYLILDDYYLPIYLIRPSKRMKVIQLWHAAGAFKKFGYSTMNTKFGPSDSYLKLISLHSNYTHVYVSSSHIIPFYSEAFNMSANRIFPIGPPRIDLFSNQEKIEKVKKNIKIDFPIFNQSHKVFILIAPTYRAAGNYRESDVDFIDVLTQSSKYLHNNIHIIFKAHPYIEEEKLLRIKQCKNITFASKYSINEWMLITDALVTDYSSSIFDFSLLEKPLAHYVPDLEEYEKNRGLYEDIKNVSDGAIIMNTEELINWINSRKKNEHYDTSRMIKYNFDNTTEVSKKVVSHFIKK